MEVKERHPDEDPAIRGIIIGKKDLITHGYTPSCPGCYAAWHNIKYKPRTPGCRERIYRALGSDDSDSKRVRDAKSQEDSWIERRVIEGEVAKPEENAKATGVNIPFLNPSSQASVPKSQKAENPLCASSSSSWSANFKDESGGYAGHFSDHMELDGSIPRRR